MLKRVTSIAYTTDTSVSSDAIGTSGYFSVPDMLCLMEAVVNHILSQGKGLPYILQSQTCCL
jgi:hypothetical protein